MYAPMQSLGSSALPPKCAGTNRFRRSQFGMYESDAGELHHKLLMLNKASPSLFSFLSPLFWCSDYFVCLEIVKSWRALSGSSWVTGIWFLSQEAIDLCPLKRQLAYGWSGSSQKPMQEQSKYNILLKGDVSRNELSLCLLFFFLTNYKGESGFF